MYDESTYKHDTMRFVSLNLTGQIHAKEDENTIPRPHIVFRDFLKRVRIGMNETKFSNGILTCMINFKKIPGLTQGRIFLVFNML